MSNPLKMRDSDDVSTIEDIKQREVGDDVPALRAIDPSLSQYDFGDLSKAVEFSKLMCQAGEMLPPHARRNPAICLALTMRATHWGFDPFALSQETFQATSGGPIGYQAKVFSAVARKAKIILQYRYEGDLEITDKPALSAKGNQVAKRSAVGNIRCICYATDGGQVLEYETPELDQITIKNSALWHNDPKQQLAYYAARGWMRRYRSDLMMGAYSDEEVEQIQMRDVSPKVGRFAQLASDAREAAKKTQGGPADGVDDDAQDQDAEEENSEAEIDQDSPEFQNGVAAGEGGLSRGDCPYTDDRTKAFNWLAGWDSTLPEEEQDGDDTEGGEE
ncbi:recombinase RecT [Sulfitobacter pseudonitzschiae]|uniref:Recombinase RecT n=1 Tax=Pseudosulfitobacter pseudonitzschiae TaxID=1402135 RepID=A0A9Q2RWB8_9RHOB|nr:recombinase RecT [Pseudosulfitobacter pseudonitzschiae]MBM2293811.1 recombinase RecT [Pseudosulfitobacter pseudonitzschiae]MBM2298728.1 recombinase RecT [Pseudosulfitobacter pseudonitzschiae]MBM2303643.1 recombinase RecT [Pseudosulfitobacter pseudonitzschiae]MBM2313425.1 recombinase RecT [Pseudosulfitobacter pseudonitzschiae]MBM2318339.1 recombinase RecT [Pseudosulfitobacter pseudonitzschiae]